MTSLRILTGFLVLSLGAAAVIGQEANDVPAYNKTVPAKLPPILKPSELQTKNLNDFQTHAYEVAAKPGMARVIAQMPCYCHCDRSLGHKSLHSCFSNHDEHGAVCGTCMQELYYSYQMHQKGWTAKQIREGIMKGEWKDIDLQTIANHD